MASNTSKIVAAGMKQLSSDFNKQIVELGFQQYSTRRWQRTTNDTVENIYLHRRGSSYGGSPINNSIHLRVHLSSKNIKDEDASVSTTMSDAVRKPNGYAYYHRFNAKTWDTYDRCLDELIMFTKDYAELWFQKQRRTSSLDLFGKLRAFFT